MLARLTRALMMALACSGLWAALLRIEPRLWTQPGRQSRETWTLHAAPGGRFVWQAASGGRGWIAHPLPHEERRYVTLDGQPCARPWGNWDEPTDWTELSGTALRVEPSGPHGPRVLCVFDPSVLGDLGPVVSARLGGGDDHQGERWYLETDAARARFHLVGYVGQPRRPRRWFDRRGFADTPPSAGDWFVATCDPASAWQQAPPDAQLRTGLERQEAWPQPFSVLLVADGAALSVDPVSHRWRRLLGPCGVEAVGQQLGIHPEYDESAQRVRLPERIIGARAGDWAYTANTTTGHVDALRLPSVLRGRAAVCARLADGTLAALSHDPAGPHQVVGSIAPGAVPSGPGLITWSRADGTLLSQRVVDFTPLAEPPVVRRAGLVAVCPLGLLWLDPQRWREAGVLLGLRWALWVQPVLWLALWLCRRRPASSQAALPPASGPRRPLLALVAKDLWRLAPATLLAAAILASRAWQAGVPKLTAIASGQANTDWTLVGALRDLPAMLLPLHLLWGCYLAWRLASDESWPWLLTRPADRARLERAKLLASGCAALSVGSAPLVALTLAGALPGVCAAPITWVMLQPLAWLGVGALVIWLVCIVVASAQLGWRDAAWPARPCLEVLAVALVVAALVALYPAAGRPEAADLDAYRHQQTPRQWSLQPGSAEYGEGAVAITPRGEVVSAGEAARNPDKRAVELVQLPSTPARRAGRGSSVEPLGCDARAWWYLVLGPRDARRYRLVAFDRLSGRCLGWLSRAGYTLRRPSAGAAFDVADGGFRIGAGNLRDYVVADRGHLRALSLGGGQGQTLLALPGLRAFAGDGYGTSACVARSADGLAVAAAGQPARTYALPGAWQGSFWVGSLVDGRAVVTDPTWPPDKGYRLLWLAPGGRVQRTLVVSAGPGPGTGR